MSAIRFVLISALLLPCLGAEEMDLSVVQRIRAEAFERSQVMEHMFYLTDVAGPRITNSPGYDLAADWSLARFQEYGLKNVHKEKWGPFGRGWAFDRFSAHMLAPQYAPLVGLPLAWTPSTNGSVKGKVVWAPIRTEADFAAYKGKLAGAIVLIDPGRASKLSTEPLAHRYTDAQLEDMSRTTLGAGGPDVPLLPGEAGKPPITWRERAAWRKKLYGFLKDEGAAVVISAGYAGDGVTIFGQAAGDRLDKEPNAPPAMVLANDHYNRILRLLAHHIPVEVEVESKTRFLETGDSYNVLAEIPGTTKADEVVMLGGHLDSWHGATGATDNGAGSAVMIEAMRILKSLKLPMKRTVRVALWGGEELGLLGSSAYVKEHFADPQTMQVKPEHAKLSAYFNIDYGPGRLRGIYLQGNTAVGPIFADWLKPFHDLDAKTIAPRMATSTDHVAFDEVGLPGFQFIQDGLEYGVTHHSNIDSFDHIQRADLMQASAILAAFVYQAANREEMLPRKPLPKAKGQADAYAGIPDVKRDIEFTPGLKMDARIPAGAGPFPAVIFVHGGGFVGGSRQTMMRPLYQPVSDAGFAWFTVDYRFAPANPFPAAVDDVKAAVRYIREHAAEYHVDPKRLALIGESAGGHLVAYAGADAPVAAVVSFYGPHDFTRNSTPRLDDAARRFTGIWSEMSSAVKQRLLAASPVSQVRKGMPPYLLIHGDADLVVPHAQSEELCAKMRAAGAACELITMPGAGHGIGGWEATPAYKQQMVEWLQKRLKR